MPSLSLSIIEIVVLMMGAIVLGITIHFFITSRKSLRAPGFGTEKLNKSIQDWKLKYFNDIEYRDKELASLKKELEEIQDMYNINMIEASENKKENKRLQSEIASIRRTQPPGEKPDYIEQLREAQTSLMEHNEKINLLLGQIDIVKETEEKQQEILKTNEDLMEQIEELQVQLSQREKEMNNVRQKENLTREMNAMLDSAYSEFNTLQGKINKLEAQVGSSKMINLEMEDIKEANYKLARDLEEQKAKAHTATALSNDLRDQLGETEDKLREANLQRQQLQKKVAYLEELNNDLQSVSDANKKLEGQLRRIGELESMLNVISEERDELAKKRL
jgi:chromosome segregation ATPase